MFNWLFDLLDRLDGNVDGAIFGLTKAQKKLDKAVEAQHRIANKHTTKSAKYADKVLNETLKADTAANEAKRAARVRDKIAELTQ